MSVSSKEFLDIQAAIECRFTLKRVPDIIRTQKKHFTISDYDEFTKEIFDAKIKENKLVNLIILIS